MSSLLCILALASHSLPAPALAQLPSPTVTLKVNASHPGRRMPDTLFGLFFEVRSLPYFPGVHRSQIFPKAHMFDFVQEINHAGSGGLWAELVQNRGQQPIPSLSVMSVELLLPDQNLTSICLIEFYVRRFRGRWCEHAIHLRSVVQGGIHSASDHRNGPLLAFRPKPSCSQS